MSEVESVIYDVPIYLSIWLASIVFGALFLSIFCGGDDTK